MIKSIKRPFKNKQEYTRTFIKKIFLVLTIYCIIIYYNVNIQGVDLFETLVACGIGLFVFFAAFLLKEGMPMDDKDIETLMYEQEILEKPIKKN